MQLGGRRGSALALLGQRRALEEVVAYAPATSRLQLYSACPSAWQKRASAISLQYAIDEKDSTERERERELSPAEGGIKTSTTLKSHSDVRGRDASVGKCGTDQKVCHTKKEGVKSVTLGEKGLA